MSKEIPPLMRILVDVSEDEFHRAWTRDVGQPNYDKADWKAVDRARNERRRAHADTEPQPKYATVDSAANAWKRRDESQPGDSFQIGDIVDWSPSGPWTTIRGRVYQISPLCIETLSGRKLDTSSHPTGVVLVATTPRIGYLSARLEKDMNAAITAQHEREVSMLWGGQQVTVKADATVRPGTMRINYEAAPERGPDAMQVRVIAHPECPPGSIYFVGGGGDGGGTFKLTLNDAPTPQTATKPATSPPTDPLDVEYDGRTLRLLLEWDQAERRETTIGGLSRLTPAQRSAISAHWSAQLRAKVAAAKQTEREQVVCERDEDGL